MAFHVNIRDWKLAVSDIVRGLSAWNIWLVLGYFDIRHRYKRSRLGQFWITLSMAIFIAGIGVVYATLFKQPVQEYIPYLTVNMVVWTLISGITADSTTAFVHSGTYLRQDAVPKTVFVLRVIVRNLIAFAHNLVIVPVVFVFFGVLPGWTLLLAIPGLMLLLIAAFLVTLASGILCTRFRDLPQIIQNVLQIAFFMTPIMWYAEQLGEAGRLLIILNPFAVFLRIVTEPIHGRVPEPGLYVVAVLMIAALAAATLLLFARARARIVYWL